MMRCLTFFSAVFALTLQIAAAGTTLPCLSASVTQILNLGQAETALIRARWMEIESLPGGSKKIEAQDAFFDYWAEHNPEALRELSRDRYNALMKLKQTAKQAFLAREQDQEILRVIQEMKQKGKSFDEALDAVTRGAVESVLTAHPTQIQSTSYRLLTQLRDQIQAARTLAQRSETAAAAQAVRRADRLGEALKQRGVTVLQSALPDAGRDVEQKLLVSPPGFSGKMSAAEEVQDSVDVYLSNMYEGHIQLRKTLSRALKESYGKDAAYSEAKASAAMEHFQTLSSWAWDADGKGSVTAAVMARQNSIQQEATYRIHVHALEDLMVSNHSPGLSTLKKALTEHAQALAKDPQSTAVIQKYAPSVMDGFKASSTSPSEQVREFFSRWVESINKTQKSEALDDLAFGLRSFYLNNQIRQNASVLQKASKTLFDALGLPATHESIIRVMRDPELLARAKTIAQTTHDPTLAAEIARFKTLAVDTGGNPAVISADTKTADDVEKTLFLMEVTGLTGKTRYFPLIENVDTFRNLPALADAWLKPGSLMRRQILMRSAESGHPPALTVMFALSDTNRLGGQGASHLMEIQAAKINELIPELFKKYPVTAAEIKELREKGFQHLEAIRAPYVVEEYWGGGSQLARGGDWISDEKRIYTDQGNARDLKYDSPQMAFTRMDRHLANGIEAAVTALPVKGPGYVEDEALILRLISKREERHRQLFFDQDGYRDAMEAYLGFGSTLNETRSNSYGARGVSRSLDQSAAKTAAASHLEGRLFSNPAGKSFDQVVKEQGLPSVEKMRLKDLWYEMRPDAPYMAASIDQRAITIDNAFSQSKFNQLAGSIEAEQALGIDAATSARLMNRVGPAFESYRRQKMAEVLATSLVNTDAHLERLPPQLRGLVVSDRDRLLKHFLENTRGKSAEDLTVDDLLATFAYMHETVRKISEKNKQVASLASAINESHAFTQAPLFVEQRPHVEFGQSLMSWMHRRTIFGGGGQAPHGLDNLFDGLPPDRLNELQYLSWAIHYEGQQLPVDVNVLTGYSR